MSLRYKARANARQRFGRSNDQKTVRFHGICDFIKEFLTIFKGEVDGNITAKYDIKFPNRSKRIHQIQPAEGCHGTDFIPYFPSTAAGFKIALKALAGQSTLDFEFIINAVACLSDGGIGQSLISACV